MRATVIRSSGGTAAAAVLAMLLVATTPSAAQSPSVTIGTWNLEWLGTPSMRDSVGRTAAQLEAIAAVAADLLDIEVLVLVEINTQAPQWQILKASLAGRGYAFVEAAPRRQTIVIAFDADEVVPVHTANPEPDVATEFQRADPGGGQCRTSNAKKPVFATLRSGAFDFTVVGVHFKSGRKPRACSDETFTSWVRGQQTEELLRAADAGQAAGTVDADVIVVGDLNGGFDDGGAQALRAGGFRLLTEPANRSPSSGALSYRRGRWESALDHIAIRPVTDAEWLPRSTVYFPDVMRFTATELDGYLAAFSDHAILAAEFRTDLSDDD
jgi:hypothetical protein